MDTVEQARNAAENALATWIQQGLGESASIEKRFRRIKKAHNQEILTVELCASEIDVLQKKVNDLQRCVFMMQNANPQRD